MKKILFGLVIIISVFLFKIDYAEAAKVRTKATCVYEITEGSTYKVTITVNGSDKPVQSKVETTKSSNMYKMSINLANNDFRVGGTGQLECNKSLKYNKGSCCRQNAGTSIEINSTGSESNIKLTSENYEEGEEDPSTPKVVLACNYPSVTVEKLSDGTFREIIKNGSYKGCEVKII